jgi:hypothetical protein
VARSVLELAVGGVPLAKRDPTGIWRYRHAVRPEGVSVLDHQAVADFLAYEAAHDREVTVVAPGALADWATWSTPPTRPRPDAAPTQCCTHVFAEGCGSDLVCHGAPRDVARRILDDGAIRPGMAVAGRRGIELAAASTRGEPADWFEHVMFANGRCTAPDAVAASRRLGRDLVPADLAPGEEPAVRFYFRWETLASRPDARFDGVHPIKIEGVVPLDLAVAVA